jgi:HD-GYP domain-containing protein (c-di-GMP phosphodiesterase class II)
VDIVSSYYFSPSPLIFCAGKDGVKSNTENRRKKAMSNGSHSVAVWSNDPEVRCIVGSIVVHSSQGTRRLEAAKSDKGGVLGDETIKCMMSETTVKRMLSAVEVRDPHTAQHARRVAALAYSMAKVMCVESMRCIGIRLAGLVHDIGKISISPEILYKTGRLSVQEFALIQTHSYEGYKIIKNIETPWPLARITLEHHERMDGSGYPTGVTGNKLLPESRILAVADVVDAMALHRPYRPALGVEAACKEIKKNSGILYDKDAVESCLTVLSRAKGGSCEFGAMSEAAC